MFEDLTLHDMGKKLIASTWSLHLHVQMYGIEVSILPAEDYGTTNEMMEKKMVNPTLAELSVFV